MRRGNGADCLGRRQRGEPKQKPPFPSDEGLYKKPSIINNVETFREYRSILLKGADWFWRGSATDKTATGTKVFALAVRREQHREL